MKIKRGDIFFAQLNPGIGSEEGVIRPVIIIQNDIANQYSPTTIIAAITSQKFKERLPTYINLNKDRFGLVVDSTILLDKISTIDKNRLREKVGSIDEETMKKVSEAWMISGGVSGVFQEMRGSYKRYYKYVLDETVNMIEDYDCEFKEIKGANPLNTIKGTIAEYAASFLNGKGGRIFYGISDNGVVKGLQISVSMQDEINKLIYNRLFNIQPAVSPDYFDIEYHPIESKGKKINNLYILEISVPITNDKSAIYYVNGNELHVRVKGVKKKLTGTEITSYIRKRIVEDNL